MDRLIVKNFGPLKDVDIELNKINLFIGENGSGKSVLGKLVTIILDLLDNINMDFSKIKKKFEDYNINFITKETTIKFISKESIYFELLNEEFFNHDSSIYQDLYKKTMVQKEKIIKGQEESSIQLEKIRHLRNKNLTDKLAKEISELELSIKNNLEKWDISKSEVEITEEKILKFSSQYIPAERNLISIFNKYVTTFISADIPLPKFLLNFSSQYVRAREEIRALYFLNVKYKFESDQERIFYNDEDYLLLERSSSGIQSALPLYLTVKYFAKKHKGIIIEEPEQNLFPKAQAETIQYIIEQVSDENNLFMMTHSPYVLSTINNLIYAHVVADLGEKEKVQVQELVNEKQWIKPDDFSAYYLENGVARSIKSDMGLISNNEIDEISEEMGAEFDELLEIYRESKNG